MSFPDVTFFAGKISGSIEGAMDRAHGDDLLAGNRMFIVTDELTAGFDIFYVYLIDTSSGIPEASPWVVSPDRETGDTRWEYTPLFDPHVRKITLSEAVSTGDAVRPAWYKADAPDRHKAVGIALYGGSIGSVIHIAMEYGVAKNIVVGRTSGEKAYIQADGSIDDETSPTDYVIGRFLTDGCVLITKSP